MKKLYNLIIRDIRTNKILVNKNFTSLNLLSRYYHDLNVDVLRQSTKVCIINERGE